jgi:acetylornithine/N-succinyldiaminopimelate aminotransferase
MAVGNAVLDVVLEDGFLERVASMSLLLKQRLAEVRDRYPALIAEVRGEGLLLGVRVLAPNTEFVAACREQGLLTVAAGENVVRLVPPLIVGEIEISEAIERLSAACGKLEAAIVADARRGAAE